MSRLFELRWILLVASLAIGCSEPNRGPLQRKVSTSTSSGTVEQTPAMIEDAKAAQPITAEVIQEPSSESRKGQRDPIYDTKTPGKELIAAALEQARQSQKNVLIEWGGNWCIWCHRLHDLFEKDPKVHSIIEKEFVLVLVDSRSNDALMHELGGADRQFSFPHLTILDAQGNVLINQNTEPLEKGDGHDPKVVADFLSKWAASGKEAR